LKGTVFTKSTVDEEGKITSRRDKGFKNVTERRQGEVVKCGIPWFRQQDHRAEGVVLLVLKGFENRAAAQPHSLGRDPDFGNLVNVRIKH